MSFFKNITGALTGAKDVIVEKNRTTALINRLRIVIRCEEQNMEREYVKLGRYYYHNLRDTSNPTSEACCTAIDIAEKRLEAALTKLDRIYKEENDVDVEEVTLDDVIEVAEEVEDGFVDEAVGTPVEVAYKAENDYEATAVNNEVAEDDENDNLPFE